MITLFGVHNGFWGLLVYTRQMHDIKISILRHNKPKDILLKLAPFRAGNTFFKLKKPEKEDKFLIVQSVQKGSSAEKKGLKPGDRVISIEGRKLQASVIIQYLEVNNFLNRFLVGWTLNFTIEREENGKKVQKKISYSLG